MVGHPRTGSVRLTSEDGASPSSSFRTQDAAVLETLLDSLLDRGAAAVVLRDRVSLAISRGAVTLVMVIRERD